MRNGKHYVQVRMTKTEKEDFLRLSKLCNAPEKTVLYWLVNDMIVYEKPPETFFKITRLMLRLQINVDHICLSRYGLSEAINKTRFPNAPENWEIFKDVHEPIIARNVFEKVQTLISKKAQSTET